MKTYNSNYLQPIMYNFVRSATRHDHACPKHVAHGRILIACRTPCLVSLYCFPLSLSWCIVPFLYFLSLWHFDRIMSVPSRPEIPQDILKEMRLVINSSTELYVLYAVVLPFSLIASNISFNLSFNLAFNLSFEILSAPVAKPISSCARCCEWVSHNCL